MSHVTQETSQKQIDTHSLKSASTFSKKMQIYSEKAQDGMIRSGAMTHAVKHCALLEKLQMSER